ncbi:MAG TPA: pyruvate ferredoxin oxidoreductase [Candidatus Moranbacteria bacterium]|nr:pyruvate ferredoxin oxidoreductase [Candidatus Moranbacteria bacterium]
MKNNTKKIKALTGGYAVAEALRQVAPDVLAVYPITPQTPIIESFAKMRADGDLDTEIMQVESEHSAMSATIGASAAGARAVTASSSQGILYMAEMLPIASGLRLPIVMAVSSRALSAPLNIHGEHGDVMAVRDMGWVQLFAQDAQEAYDHAVLSIKLAEELELPVMPIMDGFHTSHTTERVEVLPDDVVRDFVGERRTEGSLMDQENPVSYGTLALQDTYFEFKIEQNKALHKAGAAYARICRELSVMSGRKIEGSVESYHLDDAEFALVIMGATSGTAKEAVDALREKGKKVGLLRIKMYRPFPQKEVARALAHLKSIAVFDRALSPGSYAPLYQDVVTTLHDSASFKHEIASYIYGLGGRDTLQKDIEKAFTELEDKDMSSKTRYLQ